MSLQPDYVSTLPGKTKNSTKTADRLQQQIVEKNSPEVVQCSFISPFVGTF